MDFSFPGLVRVYISFKSVSLRTVMTQTFLLAVINWSEGVSRREIEVFGLQVRLRFESRQVFYTFKKSFTKVIK